MYNVARSVGTFDGFKVYRRLLVNQTTKSFSFIELLRESIPLVSLYKSNYALHCIDIGSWAHANHFCLVIMQLGCVFCGVRCWGMLIAYLRNRYWDHFVHF